MFEMFHVRARKHGMYVYRIFIIYRILFLICVYAEVITLARAFALLVFYVNCTLF